MTAEERLLAARDEIERLIEADRRAGGAGSTLHGLRLARNAVDGHTRLRDAALAPDPVPAPLPVGFSVAIVLRQGEVAAVHATQDEAYEDMDRRTGRGARPDLDHIYTIETWVVQDQRRLATPPESAP